MSKTRRRKKTRSRASARNVAVQEKAEQTAATSSARSPARRTSRVSLQNVAFSLMVTLGCLGLAVFFTFFYSDDANHFLYGGVMALTALGWLVIATRRWSAYRQRAGA